MGLLVERGVGSGYMYYYSMLYVIHSDLPCCGAMERELSQDLRWWWPSGDRLGCPPSVSERSIPINSSHQCQQT